MSDRRDLFDEMDILIDVSQIHKSFMNVISKHWKPPTDIYETAESFTIYVELPGMKKKDISLIYQNGFLTVSGSRKLLCCPNMTTLHRMEINNGKFLRKIRLNADIIEDKIEAEYLDGILTITIPKRSEQ